ncbi:hypothetical protein L581_1175 [Serratia fonticola AU-AP2C]|nr:hypothetical protein L581_1175 [Serratia fonticola AU-AP2C]
MLMNEYYMWIFVLSTPLYVVFFGFLGAGRAEAGKAVGKYFLR